MTEPWPNCETDYQYAQSLGSFGLDENKSKDAMGVFLNALEFMQMVDVEIINLKL